MAVPSGYTNLGTSQRYGGDILYRPTDSSYLINYTGGGTNTFAPNGGVDLAFQNMNNEGLPFIAAKERAISGMAAPQAAAASPIAASPKNTAYVPDYSKYGASPITGAQTGYGRNPLAPFNPGALNGVAQQQTRPMAQIVAGMGNAPPRPSPIAPSGQASYMPVMGASSYPTRTPAASTGGYARGGSVSPIKGYAEGGAVTGQGGGQSDNQIVTAHHGDFILPADVVSDLGDGNTNEGFNRLSGLFSGMNGYAKGGAVAPEESPIAATQIAISPGEFHVKHSDVKALGGGDLNVGTDKLRQIIKRVRAHKAKKGHPPMAKAPEEYISPIAA